MRKNEKKEMEKQKEEMSSCNKLYEFLLKVIYRNSLEER